MRWSVARARSVVLAAVASGLVAASCALVRSDGITASVRGGPLPMLAVAVDTDMLPDYWLALIYLASEP